MSEPTAQNTSAALPAVSLTGALDIAHAPAIKQQLLDALNAAEATESKEPALQLDGSAVSRCDAAGLQLLLAFAQHCEREAHAWSWSATSSVLVADAAGLGLAEPLQLLSLSQGGQ